MDTEKLIHAAEARAALYADDDRQDIKTDVMNAFFAGAAFVLKEAREGKRMWAWMNSEGLSGGESDSPDGARKESGSSAAQQQEEGLRKARSCNGSV